MQQQLAKIGIKATLRYEDVATWLKRIYTDYDFFLTSNFLYNLPDPVIGVHRAIHGKLIKQGTVFVNGSQWSNPRADELMDKATIEPDPKKRAEYYHEVQKIAVDGVADHLGVRAQLPDNRQQTLPRRHHEPARHLYKLRIGVARVKKLAREGVDGDACKTTPTRPRKGKGGRAGKAVSRWAARDCCATCFGAWCRRYLSFWA